MHWSSLLASAVVSFRIPQVHVSLYVQCIITMSIVMYNVLHIEGACVYNVCIVYTRMCTCIHALYLRYTIYMQYSPIDIHF